MMAKTVAALVMLVLVAAPASARQLRLDAQAGAALPVGELADVSAPGAEVAGVLAVRVAPGVAVRIGGHATMLEERDGAGTPGTNLYHATLGLERVLVPDPRLRLRAHAAAGITRFEVEAFSNAQLPPGVENRITSSGFSLHGGLHAAHALSGRIGIHAATGFAATFIDEDDTAVLELVSDDVERFGVAWTVPITLGISLTF